MQASTLTIESMSEPSDFDTVCQAAKAKDCVALHKALKNASLDVFHPNKNLTPTAQLAYEKDFQAIEFLRKYVEVSSAWIIFGLGLGGHIKEIDSFLADLEKEDRIQFLRSLHYLTYGLGLGGHVEKVLAYLKMIEERYPRENYDMAKMNTIRGFIGSGNLVEAKELIPTLEFKNFAALMHNTAYNKDEVTNATLINECLAMYPAELIEIYKSITEGYARVGNIKQVAHWINRSRADCPQSLQLIAMTILAGLCIGGHEREFYFFIQNKSYFPEIEKAYAKGIYGFIYGGHHAKAYKVLALLQKKYPRALDDALSCMATSFIRTNKISEVDNVLKNLLDEEACTYTAKNIAAELNRKQLFLTSASTLQTLASFSPRYQKSFLEELKESKESKQIAPLIPQASQLYKIMTRHSLDYKHARAWNQPEIQIWFLQCVILVDKNKLNEDVFGFIAAFLFPFPVQQLEDVRTKMQKHFRKSRFFQAAESESKDVTDAGVALFCAIQ